ncbi:hypothetical protein [Nocardia thraciensis]
MTNTTPETTPHGPAADPMPAGSLDCPVRIGDEVVLRHAPHLPAGRVLAVLDDDEITECAVQTPDGARILTYPSHLVPADPDHDTAEWELRMQRFRDGQRQRVLRRMQQRQRQVVQQAITLVRHAETIVTTLRTGHIPDPWADATDSADHPPTEFTATELDGELRQLAEYCATAVEAAGLFTADELAVHLAVPAPTAAALAPAGNAGTPVDADRWLADFHHKRRDERELYRTVCREYGLDDQDETDYRAHPEVGTTYYQRRDDLYAAIAEAAGHLVDAIEAGGPLPTAWTQAEARS